MKHEESILLAQTAHGRIAVCACGCLQLTFSLVTLHFESEAAFEAMAETVVDEERARRGDEAFDLRYDWFSMSLSPPGSAEFARLVREAASALVWARGDCELTDEDLRQMRRRPSS